MIVRAVIVALLCMTAVNHAIARVSVPSSQTTSISSKRISRSTRTVEIEPQGSISRNKFDQECVYDVNASNFQEIVLDSPVPVLVEMYADWCEPSNRLTPMLETAATNSNGLFRLAKIDIDKNPELFTAVGGVGFPTVFAVNQGKFIDRFMGAIPLEQIKEFTVRAVTGHSPSRLPIQDVSPTELDDITETVSDLAGLAALSFNDREIIRQNVDAALEGEDAWTSQGTISEPITAALAYIENLSKNIRDKKHRVVYISRSFREKVMVSPSAMDLLINAGFEEVESRHGVVLELQHNNVAILNLITQRVHDLEREMKAANSKVLLPSSVPTSRAPSSRPTRQSLYGNPLEHVSETVKTKTSLPGGITISVKPIKSKSLLGKRRTTKALTSDDSLEDKEIELRLPIPTKSLHAKKANIEVSLEELLDGKSELVVNINTKSPSKQKKGNSKAIDSTTNSRALNYAEDLSFTAANPRVKPSRMKFSPIKNKINPVAQRNLQMNNAVSRAGLRRKLYSYHGGSSTFTPATATRPSRMLFSSSRSSLPTGSLGRINLEAYEGGKASTKRERVKSDKYTTVNDNEKQRMLYESFNNISSYPKSKRARVTTERRSRRIAEPLSYDELDIKKRTLSQSFGSVSYIPTDARSFYDMDTSNRSLKKKRSKLSQKKAKRSGMMNTASVASDITEKEGTQSFEQMYASHHIDTSKIGKSSDVFEREDVHHIPLSSDKVDTRTTDLEHSSGILESSRIVDVLDNVSEKVRSLEVISQFASEVEESSNEVHSEKHFESSVNTIPSVDSFVDQTPTSFSQQASEYIQLEETNLVVDISPIYESKEQSEVSTSVHGADLEVSSVSSNIVATMDMSETESTTLESQPLVEDHNEILVPSESHFAVASTADESNLVHVEVESSEEEILHPQPVTEATVEVEAIVNDNASTVDHHEQPTEIMSSIAADKFEATTEQVQTEVKSSDLSSQIEAPVHIETSEVQFFLNDESSVVDTEVSEPMVDMANVDIPIDTSLQAAYTSELENPPDIPIDVSNSNMETVSSDLLSVDKFETVDQLMEESPEEEHAALNSISPALFQSEAEAVSIEGTFTAVESEILSDNSIEAVDTQLEEMSLSVESTILHSDVEEIVRGISTESFVESFHEKEEMIAPEPPVHASVEVIESSDELPTEIITGVATELETVPQVESVEFEGKSDNQEVEAAVFTGVILQTESEVVQSAPYLSVPTSIDESHVSATEPEQTEVIQSHVEELKQLSIEESSEISEAKVDESTSEHDAYVAEITQTYIQAKKGFAMAAYSKAMHAHDNIGKDTATYTALSSEVQAVYDAAMNAYTKAAYAYDALRNGLSALANSVAPAKSVDDTSSQPLEVVDIMEPKIQSDEAASVSNDVQTAYLHAKKVYAEIALAKANSFYDSMINISVKDLDFSSTYGSIHNKAYHYAKEAYKTAASVFQRREIQTDSTADAFNEIVEESLVEEESNPSTVASLTVDPVINVNKAYVEMSEVKEDQASNIATVETVGIAAGVSDNDKDTYTSDMLTFVSKQSSDLFMNNLSRKQWTRRWTWRPSKDSGMLTTMTITAGVEDSKGPATQLANSTRELDEARIPDSVAATVSYPTGAPTSHPIAAPVPRPMESKTILSRANKPEVKDRSSESKSAIGILSGWTQPFAWSKKPQTVTS